ncbi:MAG: hypothetical protein ACE5KV_09260, partial [Thermoplasmata archaeon]
MEEREKKEVAQAEGKGRPESPIAEEEKPEVEEAKVAPKKERVVAKKPKGKGVPSGKEEKSTGEGPLLFDKYDFTEV